MKAFEKTGGDMRDNHETRLTRVETVIENINASLIRLESKIDNLDKKFESKFDYLDKKIDSKFDYLDKKIDSKFEFLDKKIDFGFEKLNSRIWTNFYWGLAGFASIYGSFAGILMVMAHGFKWLS